MNDNEKSKAQFVTELTDLRGSFATLEISARECKRLKTEIQDAREYAENIVETVCEHLLMCAARQFPERDVQHMWHPPMGRGVRTRCSDDYLWLPAATCRYLLATGDTGVLDEPLRFVQGRQVNADEDSYYAIPPRGLGRVQNALPLSGDGLSHRYPAKAFRQRRDVFECGWNPPARQLHPPSGRP